MAELETRERAAKELAAEAAKIKKTYLDRAAKLDAILREVA